MDAFIQSVRFKKIYKNLKDYRSTVKEVYKDFCKVATIQEQSNEDMIKEFERYQKYFTSLMDYYSQRFDDSMKILFKDKEFNFPKVSAFNTIVKINNLDKVNSFDFMLNCFFTTGLKTEIGPCFGFDQKTWDDKLGFWLRLTFAKDKKLFKAGINKFIEFKRTYLLKQNLFLKTGLFF